MSIFQNTVVNKYLKNQETQVLSQKWEIYKTHFLDPTKQENIRNAKEEQYQEGFLRDLFVNVFGYTLNPNTNFNLTTELKNVKDSKKADGGIIIDNKVFGVIELKGTNTTDLSKVEAQAFGYKNNQTDCVYVITSNFEKLRFYIDNATEYIAFNLFTLTEEDFKLLYLCVAFENIKKHIPKKLKEESLSQEEEITKQLYKDYSLFKRELFQDLTKQNPQFEPLELFKKSQKLLDRFLFLFFAEDRNLLPPNSVRLILTQWKQLKDLDAYDPLYNRFKKYFGYLNTGFKGKQYDIFAYNGGLFKPDEILDSIIIDDDLLYKYTLKLADYDFASEVDVNILGHIFENSLNELDEVKAQLEGTAIDKSTTKRKKDGVFYTPKYITKYIVENTVGKLCDEKKKALSIIETDYFTDKKRQKKTIKPLVEKLSTYRDWLLQLTICDPACGSGAFLNEALNFLIAEHGYVDELQAKLFGDAMVLSDVENSILENNLFGVDLNEESVEIAKLSLWLRTAQPNRKLNSLNNNIKCGNSLIDDPEIAGDKAFHWESEFPAVFDKGGFDVVIGNPPYVIVFDNLIKEYLEDNYSVFKRNNDLYSAFYDKSIKMMNENGVLGFITPNSFVKGDYFKKLRELFVQYQINSIVDFTNFLVFADANVFSAIIVLSKTNTGKDWLLYSDLDKVKGLVKNGETSFIPENEIQKKLKELSVFEDHFLIKDVGFNYWSIGRGKVRGDSVGSRVLYHGNILNDKDTPYIKGSNFNRYTGVSINNYLRHNYNDFLNENDIFRYSSDILETTPKLIYRQTSNKLIGTIDYDSFYCDKTVHVVINKNNGVFDLHYVLGIFNSKLLNYLYSLLTEEKGRAFAQVKTVNVKKLPFKVVSDSEQEAISTLVKNALRIGKIYSFSVGKLVSYVQAKFKIEKMPKKLQNWHELEFGEFIKELNKAIKKVGEEKLTKMDEMGWMEVFETKKAEAQALKAQINQTDKEINIMVYELYDLTEEEIAIVENS